MAQNLGKQLALLRLIPIGVLVLVAAGLEFGLGVGRLWAVGLGLLAAIGLRYGLIHVWKVK